MSDLRHAATFFLIFAMTLLLYGTLLARTGNKRLLPVNAARSVRGPADVRRVGDIVVAVGAIIGTVALLVRLVVH